MTDPDFNVPYVADLARIELTAEEEARLGTQLQGILGYVKQLEGLQLDDIEPTAHATPIDSVTRPDSTRDDACLTQESALSNAPRQAGGQFVVPRVIE